jgi:hypothetical protein
MEFKIDLKNIVKIVTEKDGKRIEYMIKDGVITDATVVDEEKVIEDKIDELKATNENVRKIQEIIKLDNELDEVAKLKRDEIAEKIQLSDPEPKAEEQPLKCFRKDDAETIIELDKNGSLDEALKIKGREARIAYLKDMITKMNKNK